MSSNLCEWWGEDARCSRRGCAPSAIVDVANCPVPCHLRKNCSTCLDDKGRCVWCEATQVIIKSSDRCACVYKTIADDATILFSRNVFHFPSTHPNINSDFVENGLIILTTTAIRPIIYTEEVT